MFSKASVGSNKCYTKVNKTWHQVCKFIFEKNPQNDGGQTVALEFHVKWEEYELATGQD